MKAAGFLLVLGLAQMVGDVTHFLPPAETAAGVRPGRPPYVAVVLDPLPGPSLGSMQTRFEAPCR